MGSDVMAPPLIALTLGDVSGVGPELIALALRRQEDIAICRPVVIGSAKIFAERAEAVAAPVEVRVIGDLDEARFEPGVVDLIDPFGSNVEVPSVGQVDPAAGKFAARCLEVAFELALEGRIAGVAGAPLNKEAFRRAGYNYIDEIAFLSEFTRSEEPRLFGVLRGMMTTNVTLHIPFKDVPAQITQPNVEASIEAMLAVLAKAGKSSPKVIVAALNPHNGEGGLFGNEEIDFIRPAVEAKRAAGFDITGPFPADTLFPMALASGMDGVVCMYHDQANIARKLGGFTGSASAFIGLPVPYATTAHGTAFDLVGTGKADPSSFLTALSFVVDQSQARTDA
ncbi:MAG: pdxA [Acidimicrobiaceae bacterium]|nr:pdxA [Acidimicrobiaceae bacterium]